MTEWFEKLGRDRRTQSLIGTVEAMQSFLNAGIYSDENVQVMKRLIEIALAEWSDPHHPPS